MGSNLPSERRQALNWLEARIATWVANPTGIGLTSAAVIDLSQQVVNTRAAFTSVTAIRAEAKNETVTANGIADGMHMAAGPVIANIKNFADNQTNPQLIYDAANISPQSPPSPTPAPATPTNLKANLGSNGSVFISWDGTGATGTLYEVYRRVDGETGFTLLGNVDAKTKEFNDATLPLGTTFATYQIRAVRADTQSLFSTQFNIQFGPIAPPVAEGEAAAA